MPYPTDHRDKQRERIVQSARKLFNRHGFNSVSIARIMAGAGLTHGTFYTYFDSKDDLYTKALSCFFTDPNWKNNWDGVVIDPSKELGPQIVQAYLSPQHFDDIENSCPMVALPSDVARGRPEAREAFEEVFNAMVTLLSRGASNKSAQTTASAIAALCVGGMVVARAMASRERADALRDSCREIAIKLGGWSKNGSSQKRGRAPFRSSNTAVPISVSRLAHRSRSS
jgi:TetR/AcrR family transcriptional repressor of nem operon